MAGGAEPTPSQLSAHLTERYPSRARPIGFYPLPSQRVTPEEFDATYRPYPMASARRGLVYVHVPFCAQRCAFCRFYPGPYSNGRADQFVQTAVEQLRAWGERRAGDAAAAPVEAVFFGGGSPSVLTPDQLMWILAAMRDALPFVDRPEITMEWYPRDADAERFAAAVEGGVTRISFGIQTWDPVTAAGLGAHHDADEADRALALAQAAGFTNINVDLMANAPGQRLDAHLADVERALSWRPTMVSLNPLELTQGTPLRSRADDLGYTESDDEKRAWLTEASAMLFAAGYDHQRARNFRGPGGLHRYNRATVGIAYDIVPVGPTAYGFVGGSAVVNALSLDEWLAHTAATGIAVVGTSAPNDDEMRRSFVVSSLLELEIDTDEYFGQFGGHLTADFPCADELVAIGAFVPSGGRLRLTRDAVLFADDIANDFYSASQVDLFAQHLRVGRSKAASQYFPMST